MKFLKEVIHLTEEDDLSAIPDNALKDLQGLIRKGSENSANWTNALELVHKAYEVSNIQRPSPIMKGAWKQYEEMIQYAVQQLSKQHGINGDWRMNSTSFEEREEYSVTVQDNQLNESENLLAHNIDEIIENIKNALGLEDKELKINNIPNGVMLEVWKFDSIKSNKKISIKKI